jgi:hypothetical protein
MEPCTRCEDGEINLWSRMVSLDEQEASSGDAERVSLVIGNLALRSRGGAQVNLDSHTGHPSPGRFPVRPTVLPASSLFGESAASVLASGGWGNARNEDARYRRSTSCRSGASITRSSAQANSILELSGLSPSCELLTTAPIPPGRPIPHRQDCQSRHRAGSAMQKRAARPAMAALRSTVRGRDNRARTRRSGVDLGLSPCPGRARLAVVLRTAGVSG